MPEIIEAQRIGSGRKRRNLLLWVAIAFALFIAARITLSFWVNLLWFSSLGFDEVYMQSLNLEIEVFAFFAVATFAVIYGAFTIIRRLHLDDLPPTQTIVFGGRPFQVPIEIALRILSFAVSIGLAVISGFTMMASWPAFALFFSAQRTGSTVTDPIFGQPLQFYLFTLPAWQLVDGWLLTLAMALFAIAFLFFILTGTSRTVEMRGIPQMSSPWRGLSMATSFLLFVLAVSVFVSRYEELLDHHTIFDGINYTDAHIRLPGLLIVAIALVLGSILSAINAAQNGRVNRVIGAVVPAAVCYILLGITTWYVSNFIVKPNQLVREEPYIAHNLTQTRLAYGLDRFTQNEFPAETDVNATDPANNQPTFKNIRLWDWHALQDTLRQVQEIRTYYDFPDIDIDRYVINGVTREVMLAQRELNVDKLPISSRNWINEKLIYTHGYGVTMNPVNGFTPEGLPTLLLSNMPVQSTVPGLEVKRPELYFGELTDTDVYVKTRQQEFDYPQGQSNNLTSYQGTGGVVLGNFLRRVLIAIDRDDLGTLPFSDDVTPDSRLLMHRNIRERVAKLAPFLTYDSDPYIVVGDDGRLSWIIDAFITSNTYPYSTHYTLGDEQLNYMRNSVKVVIDAYNGSTSFYVFDDQDPIVQAYRRLFPTLFKSASEMPADMRRHVRYPEALFKLQAEVYGLYHMTNPEVFFNREDLWTVATQTSSTNGEQSMQTMLPNFVLMKLPGGTAEEFVEILPFTPANRNNLIGWMAGRSDGAAYGTAVVYDFPKTRLIDGPQQIEARIDQNAQLSGQLTLWNQQGSHVLRGSLLVIPSGRALLYAEPIYLQAQQSPMPELRLVVLALQDKLAYGTTFEAALTALFGGQPSSLTPTEAPPPANAAAAAPVAVATLAATANPSDMNALITEAGKDFSDYQHLTAAGKLGEAGQKLDQLKHVLDRLNAVKK